MTGKSAPSEGGNPENHLENHLDGVWTFDSDEQRRAMLEPITKANCGDKLRLVRDVSGLSRAELAQSLGVSESTIYRLETRQTAPTDDFMLRLAALVAIGHARYARMSEEEKEKLSAYLAATGGAKGGIGGAIAATAARDLLGRVSAAGVTSGLAAIAGTMLGGLEVVARLPLIASAAGYKFVKNIKAVCDANSLRVREVDGRYEIARKRPLVPDPESIYDDLPPLGGGKKRRTTRPRKTKG